MLIRGSSDPIEDSFVAPSAPVPPDFRMIVEEIDKILQRVEPLDGQTNDSPERPDLICRACGARSRYGPSK